MSEQELAEKLQIFLGNTSTYGPFQFGFKSSFRIFIPLMDYHYFQINRSSFSLLILLRLTVAFGTVSQFILLTSLESGEGIKGMDLM